MISLLGKCNVFADVSFHGRFDLEIEIRHVNSIKRVGDSASVVQFAYGQRPINQITVANFILEAGAHRYVDKLSAMLKHVPNSFLVYDPDQVDTFAEPAASSDG